MKVSNKENGIYFEYLFIKKFDTKYHLVSIDDSGYRLLIPSSYRIDYTKSLGNYRGLGHINFMTKKNSFVLDYEKIDYSQFQKNIEKVRRFETKSFVNYRGQIFCEVLKDNVDMIYMYYNNFMYKISSNSKLTINEYFDMYFVLFSIDGNGLISNLALLTEINKIIDNGVYSFCNEEDILIEKLDLDHEVFLNQDDIYVLIDEEYQNYKSKISQVVLIGYNVLNNLSSKELSVVLDNNMWVMKGIYFFGGLGYYKDGLIKDYSEIVASSELSDDEKSNLLTTILKQKQIETDSYQCIIRDEFLHYIENYFKNTMNYKVWDKYHLREFVNYGFLDQNYDDYSDDQIYKMVEAYLHSDSDFNKLINFNKICDSVVGERIAIYPESYELTLSACNGFLHSVTIKFGDQYLIKM